MKKIRQMLTAGAVSLFSAAALCSGSALHCAASGSVDDVYNAMRRIGMPESLIQDARTQYQNTQHDSEGMTINGTYYTYDIWADMVEVYQDDIWDEVAKQFNLTGEELRQSYATATAPTQTTAGSAAGTSKTTQTTAAVTTTQPSITTDKPFVNMTLEEKQAYVASLPENERAAFVAGLSTSERNSIIKQMNPESQAAIAQGFIDLGETLGMHVSVNEIGNGSIDYSVRNADGVLIDSASIGNTIDDTGWNTTLPVLGASAAILGAVGGVIYLSLRFRKQETEA